MSAVIRTDRGRVGGYRLPDVGEDDTLGRLQQQRFERADKAFAVRCREEVRVWLVKRRQEG